MKSLITLIFNLFIAISLFGQNYTENILSNPDKTHGADPKNQKFVFTSITPAGKIAEEIKNVDKAMIRSHFLGTEIARRIYLFENQYSHQSKAAPGAFSGRRVIHKPVIYNSIYQIEKHFKKQVRKENIDTENASYELSRYIELALLLLHEDTKEFEKALKKAESTNDLMNVFSQVEIRYTN